MRRGWLLTCILMLLTAGVLYPLAWVLEIALSGNPSLGGGEWSTRAIVALGATAFPHAFVNSMVVSLAATIVGMVFATTGAYALSRLRFKGRQATLSALLFTQMFPGLLMSVPMYLGLKWIGLLGTTTGLILVYATVSVPFCVWMLKGFFDAIPKSLEEAARIDGANDLQVFWHVALPLVRPGLAVTALYAFMGAWNEYILAATFLSREERYTAPIVLRRMVGSFGGAWGEFAAGSVIVSLPVIAVFFVLQRHLVSGLLAGGVKE